jgi:predicted protein tyrosine phosphatase
MKLFSAYSTTSKAVSFGLAPVHPKGKSAALCLSDLTELNKRGRVLIHCITDFSRSTTEAAVVLALAYDTFIKN